MKRRYCCWITAAVGMTLFLIYHVFGAQSFSALRDSKLEEQVSDGEWITMNGRIYQKIRKKEEIDFLLQLNGKQQFIYVNPSDNEESENLKIGQIVKVSGEVMLFSESPNPGNFNQKFYYHKQHIYLKLKDASVSVLQNETNFLSCVRETLWKFQQEMNDRMIACTGERYGGIFSAMLLGEDCFANEEVKELLQKSGIGHLLAISGLHVSFLGSGIYKIQRKLGMPIMLASISSSFVLSVYMLMIGSKVSAQRAWIMFLLQMGAEFSGREYDGQTALSSAALLLWMQEPVLLFDASFLLSFGAVVGIYVVAPRVKLKIPLAIQMVLLPIQLYYYYEICIYALVWNLLAIPLSTVVMGSGIIGILLQNMVFVPEEMVRFVLGIGTCVLWFYEKGSRFIVTLPGSRWILGQPEFWQMTLYYTIMLFCLVCCRKKKLLIVAGMVLLGSRWMPSKELKISMLDVGQGDCLVIQNPGGGNYLMDGGSSSINQVGRYRMEPFLKQQGIGSIDYAWVSHGDADHLNGVLELLERKQVGISIKNLILPPGIYWNEHIMELAEAAQKAGTKIHIMWQGKTFQDNDMQIRCLWPAAEDETLDENQASIVLSLHQGSFDMLLTGDLEKEAEEKVTEYVERMQKKAVLPETYDVLKVGHHGSKNATSKQFLECVRPQIAWISAGRKNSYGHPHKETLVRLESVGSKVQCTATNGVLRLEIGDP